jgi:hypothetical protein
VPEYVRDGGINTVALVGKNAFASMRALEQIIFEGYIQANTASPAGEYSFKTKPKS